MSDLISRKYVIYELLKEREHYPPMVAERYSFGVKLPHHFNQAMRGGIRKALRCIETSPAVDAVEVVRCRDCIYWKPPHIRFDDGTERPYLPGEGYVSISVGINVGGQCLVDCGVGYPCDKTVFRSGNMFCSKGVKMDAEVEDLETMGEDRAYCDTCLHNNTNSKEEPCSSCMSGYLINNWQWRGVQEVE